MRPSVSMNVCWPVKYGWQAAQVFTVMVFTVEFVSKTLPQAHVTVAGPYSGCVPFFM